MHRIAAIMATLGIGATAWAAPAPPDSTLRRDVDRYLAPYVAGGNFSGAVLVARRGRVLVSRGYGMANRELGVPNTPRTRFHIASVSKAFTAAAILMLEARGKLSISDPLSRFLPDFPNAEKITLQHLLTHISGVPDINDAPFYEAESKRRHTPADLVGLIRGLAPSFAPGELYAYSNSNYNLLAYVIEAVSGEDYGAFLERNVFFPLGMSATGHDGRAEALVPNRASGYVPAGASGLENAPWFDWSVKTGNGSLYSTVEDLYKFDRALRTERLLPKSALDKILAGGRGNVYGWFVGERLGRKRMAANGRSPGFTSTLERYPEDEVTVIVLSNTYSTVTQSPIAADLAAIALGESYAASTGITPVMLKAKALEACAGEYVGGPDFFFPGTKLTVTARDGYLQVHWSTGADALLAPLSETEFLDRSFWARVRFVKDEQGAVTKLIWRHDGRDYPASRAGQP